MEMREIIAICREENTTIDGMMSKEGQTLDEWICGEKDKLMANRALPVLEKKEDLVSLCGEYVAERISGKAAEDVEAVMSQGILYTANHLGGLYSPQSFQGDLAYARMLEKVDKGAPCVPMVSFGLVPLNSTTFARGLMAYSRADDVERIPIYPKAPTNAVASLTEGFDAAMVRRAKDKAINEVRSYLVKKQIRSLMEGLYLREDVLRQKRYADQVILLGEGLYERLSDVTGRHGFNHMEAESLFAKLFVMDFAKKDGLLRQLLKAPECVRALNETKDTEGRAFSGLLFRGCGKDKRCFTLNLFEDGVLRGRDVNGKEVEIPAEEGALKEALAQMRILPHVYLSWLMSGFMRGFTWYGGILQSQYLQGWQRRTLEMFETVGLKKEAGDRLAYNCSGYLSGPIYLLFDAGDGAVNAGPLECMAKKLSPERLDRLFRETEVRAAHEMGMFEFYNDLILPNEKAEGWYETIAKYCKKNYESHTLQSL